MARAGNPIDSASFMIKPRRLHPGDTVAALTLSWGGPGAFPHRYEAGKRQFEAEFGVRVVETRHAMREPAWIARNPQARADDLVEAFADASIDGIIATIGGDDAIRLLPLVDRSVIRAHPKVFLGYSDTTIAHLLCFQAGLVSFYGPSFMAGFAENGGMFPYMVDAVRRTLFSAAPVGIIAPNREGWTVERLDWANPDNQRRKRALTASTDAGDGAGGDIVEGGTWRFLQGSGVAEGHLIGGCLEVLSWARGTSIWPDAAAFDRAILFLETSEEAPPPIAVVRELRIFAAMGILQRLAGLIVGRPGGDVPVAAFDDYDRAILQVIAEEQGLTHLPIVTRMDFGHTDPMFVLPCGVTARIDSDRRQFAIIEPAVT